MLSTISYLHYFYFIKSDGAFSNYLKLLDFKNVKIKIRKKYIYNRNYFHNSKEKGGHTVNKQSKNIKLRKNQIPQLGRQKVFTDGLSWPQVRLYFLSGNWKGKFYLKNTGKNLPEDTNQSIDLKLPPKVLLVYATF